MIAAREALSLFGFIADEYRAAAFIAKNWAPRPAQKSPRDEWVEARGKLGPANRNAGRPRLADIPARHRPYVESLKQVPWIAAALGQDWRGAKFRTVEIDPLLTPQYVLEVDRAHAFAASLSRPPGVAQLLAMALPSSQKEDLVQVVNGPGSLTIRSKCLDLHLIQHGLSQDSVGLRFGFSPPLVQVVRFNGRCYLHNGVHRAYAARLAGAATIPCLLRDVTSPDAIGLASDGSSFDLALMESANPPTMAHFTQHKAHTVWLRPISRVIQVRWGEYTVVEE